MLIACSKPSWISSFDVVKIIRTHLQEKVGHSGTLDPMASWLMLLWTWKGTKLLTQLIGLDKSYTTTIDFSLLTDTWDASFRNEEIRYEVKDNALEKDNKIIPAPSLDTIKKTLDNILFEEGKEKQLPLPTFSAKKQNGKRLYKAARKWKAEIQEKAMKIYSYNIIDYTFPLLKVKFNVWSWTYIRSIGYRLGQQLNLWWALIQLERTKIWKIELNSIGENNSAKWNIKWVERTIYYKEVTLEEIWITPTLNEEVS